MQFSQHALEKCALYGVNPELVRVALEEGRRTMAVSEPLNPDTGAILFRHPKLRGIHGAACWQNRSSSNFRWVLATDRPGPS